MRYTEKYRLLKPAQTDYYDVDDFNENMDKIEEQLSALSDGVDNSKTYTDQVAATKETAIKQWVKDFELEFCEPCEHTWAKRLYRKKKQNWRHRQMGNYWRIIRNAFEK